MEATFFRVQLVFYNTFLSQHSTDIKYFNKSASIFRVSFYAPTYIPSFSKSMIDSKSPILEIEEQGNSITS